MAVGGGGGATGFIKGDMRHKVLEDCLFTIKFIIVPWPLILLDYTD